jgi:hypothetical protein
MRPSLLCIGISVVIVGCFTLPPIGYAEHGYEIVVTIGDTTLTSSSPHTSVNIPNQTYTHAASGGSITIANSNGTARVEQTPPIADSTNDALRMLNVRITANNSNVINFPITFKRRMIQNPNTPPALYYKTNANGTFQQATGSSILWGQYVKNPLGGGFLALGSKQYTPGIILNFNQTINSNHQWPTPPTHADMSGDRVLKVEVTVKLANTKYLDLANGISMFSSLQPDPDPNCPPDNVDCNEPPPLILPSTLEAAEVVGKRGWFCRVFSWGCPD